jgi:amino acid permease
MIFGNKKLTFGAAILLIFLLFSCFLLILIYKITHINLFHRFSEDLIYIALSPTPLLLLLFIGFLLPFTNQKNKK